MRAKLLSDIGAWAGNVSTSVFIVFINKLLMQTFGYHFATTLVRALGGGVVPSPGSPPVPGALFAAGSPPGGQEERSGRRRSAAGS